MWIVDFFDTDREYHSMCDKCKSEIPEWLFRWTDNVGETEADECEGCARKEMHRRWTSTPEKR